MPATTDGRCWSCVQRRRWYPEGEVVWVEGDLRHLSFEGQPLCELPRRGRSRDPEVVREYTRRYAAKKTPAYMAKRRRDHLRRHYGITSEEFDRVLEEQGGLCASCWEAPATDVDHNHQTGVFRGILCGLCNRMIGQAGDSPARLLQGAEYLLRPEPLKAKAVKLVRQVATV